MFNYSEKAADLIVRASQHLNKPCEYMAVLDVFEELLDQLEKHSKKIDDYEAVLREMFSQNKKALEAKPTDAIDHEVKQRAIETARFLLSKAKEIE